MDELDNILSDSPSENPVETEDVEQPSKETVDSAENESDSNKLEVEDQENENSSDRQVDDDAQVPQEDEEQESDKKEEDDQEDAQNAKDDEEKDEASEGETKKERRKRKKEKKSKKDKKDKKDKKRKKKSKDNDDENLKSKIFGDSEDEEEADSKRKDADFDTADVDIEEEGKRALEEIVEKKKEKKKKRSRDREEKKKSRSSKKKKGEDEDDSDAVPEQVLPPSNEPNDFDLVIDSLKKGHRRRKSGPPEGSEEFVRSFVHSMDIAAEEDIRANQQHLPALNKVKLLPEVATQLAKKFLHEIFVSAGVLHALKKWLDPLPDGSLPNIKVREVVLHGLLEMGGHVQTEDLRESGIGKAIMVLSKHPQETLANKKTAKALVELWSRPIFNLSSKYRDLHRSDDIPIAENEQAPTPVKSVKAVSTDLDHSPSGVSSTKSTKDNPSLHARIPDKIALDFKVMPKENEEAKRLLALPKRGGDSKGLNRKSPGNKKVDRAIVMSIEGRGVYH